MVKLVEMLRILFSLYTCHCFKPARDRQFSLKYEDSRSWCLHPSCFCWPGVMWSLTINTLLITAIFPLKVQPLIQGYLSPPCPLRHPMTNIYTSLNYRWCAIVGHLPGFCRTLMHTQGVDWGCVLTLKSIGGSGKSRPFPVSGVTEVAGIKIARYNTEDVVLTLVISCPVVCPIERPVPRDTILSSGHSHLN